MSQALSCSCGLTPCQTPTCCDSGYYTLDECGCCLTCAKAKDEVCGGPFEIAGACATGLRCLRQCGQYQCIFSYKNDCKMHTFVQNCDSFLYQKPSFVF